MQRTTPSPRRRVRALLLVSALVALTAACSSGPSEEELRREATSPAAASRRAAEERNARGLVERLSAVEGLEHVLTRFTDTCARPPEDSLLEQDASPHALVCDIRADAYFGVRGDITDVLRRIRAAGLAEWGPRDGTGREMPNAAGTVTYALAYHRAHGRFKDGSLMPGPALEAPGLRIDWDRDRLPLPNRIEEPAPCPPRKGVIHERCSITPKPSTTVSAARARHGTVLTLNLDGPGATWHEYFTVPRGD
ncbi:hypothetical protein ACWDQ0_03895 [Streptomyces sp. NPDC003642]